MASAEVTVHVADMPEVKALIAQLVEGRDRAVEERDQAKAYAERAELVLAVAGQGVDPEGFYFGTPGWRLRGLLDVVEAAKAFAIAARSPENGQFWRQPWAEMTEVLKAVDALDATQERTP